MSDTKVISNFEFLKDVNDQLFILAFAAEKNYPDDPNITMFKLRQFGEVMATQLGQVLDAGYFDRQVDLVRELAKNKNIDSKTIEIFTKLRQVGNTAVHDLNEGLHDAQMMLRLTHSLSKWYYYLIKPNSDLVIPPFVLPTRVASQVHDEQMSAQIIELKQALDLANAQNTETKQALKKKENNLIHLHGQISVLESKNKETEQQANERIKALELTLSSNQAILDDKTDKERKAYFAQMNQNAAARQLDLSERETRYLIDKQLQDAGWQANTDTLTFAKGARPAKGLNMAIAEWPTGRDETGKTGFADYVLFIGLKPVAAVEAKKMNIDIADKLNEAERYSIYFDFNHYHHELESQTDLDPEARKELENQINAQRAAYDIYWPHTDGQRSYKLPFVYSANGRKFSHQLHSKSGIWFRDVRRANHTSKPLTQWHQADELELKLNSNPEKSQQWFAQNNLEKLGLRYFQEEAVLAVEESIKQGKQNLLLAMATGTGKTRTAIALMYRLIQSKRFNRILFLVDRRSLGEQALGSFDETRLNDVPFNTIFNIKGLTDKFPSDATKIHVATVQSLVIRTLFNDEFMPIGRYDCVIVDEAHRGYILDKEQTEGEMAFRNQLDYVSSYRRILDHFDAVKIGLTATPAKHTVDIFGHPVYRYSYRKAVIDGFLNDQEPPIKIKTQLSKDGLVIDQGTEVSRITHQGVLIDDTLEDDQDFEVADFNRNIIIPAFNEVVAHALANEGSIDPTSKQKTLIFCVNNQHADMVVEKLKAAFKAKYPLLENDAIIKITGNSDKDSKKVQSLITRFDKERLPNIVVTVDLLTTGIDVPSICNLVFLRKVKSRILYEQMKGRATRLCPQVGKTSFKIFDAVDLYDTLESVDSMKPVVVRPQVPISALVNELTDAKTYDVKEADGRSFAEHSHDQLVTKLQRLVGLAKFHQQKSPALSANIKRFDEILNNEINCDFASLPKTLKNKGPKQTAEFFNKLPNFIAKLEALKTDINALSLKPIFMDLPDALYEITYEYGQHDKPEDFLDAFDKLVASSQNDQLGLQTVINSPKDLTRKGLLELQEWFDQQHFDESTLKTAWKKVKNQDIAARLIGHIRRAAVGDALMPFDDRVDNALGRIKAEKDWKDEQVKWLDRLAASLKQSVALDDDSFKIGNYRREGGKPRLEKVFDNQLDQILEKFNRYMWEQSA